MKRKKKRTPRPWAVVATAHTARGLSEAATLRRGSGIDLVELRLDCLDRHDRIAGIAATIKLPLILTARHPREGGARCLSDKRRADMLRDFMPLASLVDVELRSVRALRGVLEEADRLRVGKIFSFHDFRGTPPVGRLKVKLRDGLRLGASIVKIATTLRTPQDLVSLLVVQASSDKVATMGMGTMGKVSRLVLPVAGSRLVYGYLDRPQVPGQWPAALLAARLAELTR